ncbi:bacteriocin-protection, YdeI or OmpD-associated-domain-containing protein [Cercophora newfieldiana]|uniref:Bacteriocin-protection, YdeI or OmpD-associated-domain-containing protein n=1 Tax=Cercophora newfieldiana TaxID=92897 RepID=A0AA39XU80_9PEZI|nr:bacteriocin-protection, YdeI or OmpD-associated-domain-containing protein [Cercophora newfieldiana]
MSRTTRSAAKVLQAAAPTAPASSPKPTASLPIHLFEDIQSWETWLETNHTTETTGVLLKISKKSCSVPSVTYDEAVDTALCFGWIDGQRKSHDENHFLQRFTPRRKASIWSKRNVDKVAVLVESGRMRPAGQTEVDAAKADGRWEKAYAGSRTIAVPEDFEVALSRNKKAKNFFETLGKTKRFSFLWRIETAKRAETRKKRIDEFVALLAQQKTL